MRKRKARRARRNPSPDRQWIDRLEGMVDAETLAKTVDALSGIAFLKAEHISQNWQDEGLARLWTRAGKLLDNTSVKLRKLGV